MTLPVVAEPPARSERCLRPSEPALPSAEVAAAAQSGPAPRQPAFLTTQRQRAVSLPGPQPFILPEPTPLLSSESGAPRPISPGNASPSAQIVPSTNCSFFQ